MTPRPGGRAVPGPPRARRRRARPRGAAPRRRVDPGPPKRTLVELGAAPRSFWSAARTSRRSRPRRPSFNRRHRGRSLVAPGSARVSRTFCFPAHQLDLRRVRVGFALTSRARPAPARAHIGLSANVLARDFGRTAPRTYGHGSRRRALGAFCLARAARDWPADGRPLARRSRLVRRSRTAGADLTERPARGPRQARRRAQPPRPDPTAWPALGLAR